MKRVIDIPDEIYDDIEHGYICSEYADILIQLIPSSKPYEERPQGKWVFDGVYCDENNPFDSDVYHCNLCKRSIMTACLRPEDLFPFCHCGAEMRGREE